MRNWLALAAALIFLWLGMVLAISFLEAPLKFRTPGVTIPLGLGIGRLVFRALNAVEVLLLVVVAGCAVAGLPGDAESTACLAALVLLLQLVAVRPRLNHRSDAVLAGRGAPRSHAHHAYVGLEVVKVAALVATGALLLTS